MFSSWPGPTTTLFAETRLAREMSADAAVAGRSHMASRVGAAGLVSQQTGASGAGSAGSTKGVEAPCDRAPCVAPYAREPMPAS